MADAMAALSSLSRSALALRPAAITLHARVCTPRISALVLQNIFLQRRVSNWRSKGLVGELGFGVRRQTPGGLFVVRSSLLSVEVGVGVAGGVQGVGKKMGEVVETVRLTEEEERIFGLLMATLEHFGLDTQLRVAGGWVRDKLLGKDSHDIDIALDNMLGKQFCEKVNEYLKSIGEATSGVGVIQSNPEQSKHLETANMRVKGVSIDFVNLRAETYAQNSRIPTMEFGTAEQDALRRDLTINSLFYNINNRSVEDLTSRGIRDLKAGIIRTPLPPKETFLDDPLRVIRAVRFGARFGFELEEELKVAASSDEVKKALGSKVSRERVGHEIDLMLKGKRPSEAIQCLEELQLFPVIFTDNLTKISPPLQKDVGRSCVEYMQAVGDVLAQFECVGGTPEAPEKLPEEERRLCYLSAFLLPLRHHTASYPEKKGSLPISELIIKESLKLKSEDAKKVLQLHLASEQFVGLTKSLLDEIAGHAEDDTQSEKRVQAGLLLYDIKSLWKTALVLSSVLYPPLDQGSIMKRAHRCVAVKDVILNMGLENVWTRKPLLNGNKVMNLLGLKKGGPQMKEWMGRFQKWELAHPEGNEEQCLEWFHSEHVKRLKSH